MKVNFDTGTVTGELEVEARTEAGGYAAALTFAGALRARGWNVDAVTVTVTVADGEAVAS